MRQHRKKLVSNEYKIHASNPSKAINQTHRYVHKLLELRDTGEQPRLGAARVAFARRYVEDDVRAFGHERRVKRCRRVHRLYAVVSCCIKNWGGRSHLGKLLQPTGHDEHVRRAFWRAVLAATEPQPVRVRDVEHDLRRELERDGKNGVEPVRAINMISSEMNGPRTSAAGGGGGTC